MYECVTINKDKFKVELDGMEEAKIMSLLWNAYVHTGDKTIEKAHLIVGCLFHGKVKKKGV